MLPKVRRELRRLLLWLPLYLLTLFTRIFLAEKVSAETNTWKTWYGNIFIIQTLQNTKSSFFFPWELFKNIKRNFESRIAARVMKILFLSWGDFFSNVVLLFFEGCFFLRFWQGFIAAFTFLLWCASQKLWDFFITDLKKNDMLQLLDLGFEPMH